MKKTILITIDKFSFNFTEEAFDLLDDYLNRIGKYLADDIKDEVLKEVEFRIAEILLAKNYSLIDVYEINEVIKEIGNPSDFGDEDQQEESYNEPKYANKKTDSEKETRRLYRSEQDKVIGGVASGLGYYFNIDPVFFRVFFALSLFFFGWGVILYIILYFAMPPAQTTVEVLKMKGQKASVNTIEKKVRELSEQVKDLDANQFKKKAQGLFVGVVNFVATFFTGLGKGIKWIWVLVAGLLAVIFLASGISAIFSPDNVEVGQLAEVGSLTYMTIAGIGALLIGVGLLFSRAINLILGDRKVKHLGNMAFVAFCLSFGLLIPQAKDIYRNNIRKVVVKKGEVEVELYAFLDSEITSYQKENNEVVFNNRSNKTFSLKGVSIKDTTAKNIYVIEKQFIVGDSIQRIDKTVRDYNNRIQIRSTSKEFFEVGDSIAKVHLELILPQEDFRMDKPLFELLEEQKMITADIHYHEHTRFVFNKQTNKIEIARK